MYRYGDRFAKTSMGRILTIVWMLMGIVLYGMLLSFLSTMLTTKTMTFSGESTTRQVTTYTDF